MLEKKLKPNLEIWNCWNLNWESLNARTTLSKREDGPYGDIWLSPGLHLQPEILRFPLPSLAPLFPLLSPFFCVCTCSAAVSLSLCWISWEVSADSHVAGAGLLLVPPWELATPEKRKGSYAAPSRWVVQSRQLWVIYIAINKEVKHATKTMQNQ